MDVNKYAAYETIDAKSNINSTLTRAGINGPNGRGTLRRHLALSSSDGTNYFGAYVVYLPLPLDGTRTTYCLGVISADRGWMEIRLMNLVRNPMTWARPASLKPRLA